MLNFGLGKYDPAQRSDGQRNADPAQQSRLSQGVSDLFGRENPARPGSSCMA